MIGSGTVVLYSVIVRTLHQYSINSLQETAKVLYLITKFCKQAKPIDGTVICQLIVRSLYA